MTWEERWSQKDEQKFSSGTGPASRRGEQPRGQYGNLLSAKLADQYYLLPSTCADQSGGAGGKLKQICLTVM